MSNPSLAGQGAGGGGLSYVSQAYQLEKFDMGMFYPYAAQRGQVAKFLGALAMGCGCAKRREFIRRQSAKLVSAIKHLGHQRQPGQPGVAHTAGLPMHKPERKPGE